ncbi:MAG: Transcriptional regulator [Parcubacteria group bacterium GW2011_GWA2_44_12]|nr:MAG: Transcriptional regulator [Parcubacteria group bacterium GW2011_GWA2_44_12]
MSGHSKWATIKRAKGATDAKRANMFTKLAKAISLAARDGKDPEANIKLRIAVEKAKAANVPKDNIERAILRGAGELAGQGALEEISYEAYGPCGVALIISAITDNRNRTTANIKHLLHKHGGSLAEVNSVLWNFKRRGVVRIAKEHIENAPMSRSAVELTAIDAGAEDIITEQEGITIYSAPDNLMRLKECLGGKNILMDSSEAELVSMNKIALSKTEREKVSALIEALEDDQDVSSIYTNTP